jgi:two-component system NtrC family response regulator
LGTDILTIAESFINYFAADFGKHITALTPKAKEKLLNYRWPGNVRELRNIIERAAIFADGPEIDADDCILTEQSYESSGAMQSFNLPESKLSLFDVEKHLIVKALQKFKANQTKTAKYLGLTLDTLRYRMKKYDIE